MNGQELQDTILTTGPLSPFSPRGPLLPGAPWKKKKKLEILRMQPSRYLLTQPLIVNPNVEPELLITIHVKRFLRTTTLAESYRIHLLLQHHEIVYKCGAND